MTVRTAHTNESEKIFLEREAALAEERRYSDLQQCPDCTEARGQLKGMARKKNR